MEFQGAKKLQFCDCHSEPPFKILCYASLSPSPNPPLTHSTGVFFCLLFISLWSNSLLVCFPLFLVKIPWRDKKDTKAFSRLSASISYTFLHNQDSSTIEPCSLVPKSLHVFLLHFISSEPPWSSTFKGLLLLLLFLFLLLHRTTHPTCLETG